MARSNVQRHPSPVPARIDTPAAEGLDAFATEAEITAAEPAAGAAETVAVADPAPSPASGSRGGVKALIALPLVVAILGGGFWAYKAFAVAPPTATLSVRSNPEGAQVTIDGRPAGVTPLSTTVTPGAHNLVLVSPTGQARTIAVTVNAGDSLVQQVEWAPAAAAAAPTSGSLHVQTDPLGQAVVVDDVRRGVSPLTIGDLSPGEHRVAITSDAGTVRRQVTITPGETMSLVIAPTTAAVSAGFVRVTSPVLLQLRSGGNLIGNTENSRVMLPAGDHELEMINEALGFSATRRVNVSAGRTTEVRVTPPNGTLSINAVPWAEVWINGERLGETPLANVTRPIGSYTVVLRHPQFGERQRTVTVSTSGPTRLGVDMRQQ